MEDAVARQKQNELSEISRNVGSSISHLRRERGLTQTELAEKTAMTQSSISRIEHGYNSVNIKTLVRMATAPGVKLSVELVEERQD